MVDALQEACRVVVPGGIVVDLRPVSARYRLEVVTDAVARDVAEIEAYEAQDDDHAAMRRWSMRYRADGCCRAEGFSSTSNSIGTRWWR